MNIDHIAIWVTDLEQARIFYQRYFDLACGDRYHNPNKNFTSYFLSFHGGGARIEIMQRPDILPGVDKKGVTNGITHFAISVGSKQQVDAITNRMRSDGVVIQGEPRTTGDGYYESVVLDGEGNLIEITE